MQVINYMRTNQNKKKEILTYYEKQREMPENKLHEEKEK